MDSSSLASSLVHNKNLTMLQDLAKDPLSKLTETTKTTTEGPKTIFEVKCPPGLEGVRCFFEKVGKGFEKGLGYVTIGVGALASTLQALGLTATLDVGKMDGFKGLEFTNERRI